MFRIDVSELVKSPQQLAPALEAAAQNVLADTARFAADAARTSPYFRDTGRPGGLRSGIRRTVRSNWHQAVSAGTSGPSMAYALFVETGTKPHIIRARNAKYLRFVQDGAVRYAKQVFHPGTPGTPITGRPTHYKRGFMKESQREAAAMIPTFIEANFARLLH
jgi:hypothetical protein